MKGLRVWNDEIKKAINDKNIAYHIKLQNNNDHNKQKYKDLSNIVKTLCREAEQERWNKYIADIENDIHGRQNFAYKAIKYLNNEDKDRANIQTISTKEWLKYYKTLWSSEDIITSQSKVDTTYDNSVDDIELHELEETLQRTKNKKATGSDNINTELIKYASFDMKQRLLQLFNMCWKTKVIPSEWQEAVVCPIFKKGDRNNCENYRGISLLNAAYKIYSRIITRRLSNIVENILLEEQTGFRRGRSCIDNVHIIKQIIEQHREFNRETHILFVDYVKAFDRIDRNILFNILDKRGVPKHLIETIKSMYKNSTISMTGNTKQKEIVNLGLRQGCSMSPLLFNLYIDEVIREWKNRLTYYNFNLNYRKYVFTLLFADDQAIIADSEDSLQKALYELHKIAKNFNLLISTNKTKVMAFKGVFPVRSKIILDNIPIEQVNNFKFLGCKLSYLNELDIKHKVERFNFINGTINRTLKNKVRKDTLMKFYKTLAIPSILYGSETWVLTTKDETNIQSSEMRFLRAVAGYRLIEQKRNVDIRHELQIDSLNQQVQQYRSQWSEHIERMPDERLPKKLSQYRARGKRSLGRPKKRWKDQL